MKKLILLLVAVATCVLFTACPNKPDEGVVIPDGLYEETAHIVRQDVLDCGNFKEESLGTDTVYVTQVLIDRGEFIYQDMCSDTFQIVGDGVYVRYNPHFIYLANAYCPNIIYRNGETQVKSTETNPARMSSDGFIVIPAPRFSDFGRYAVLYWVDSNYVYRAPVSEEGGTFCFEQNHKFTHGMNEDFTYEYHITHTLRRL